MHSVRTSIQATDAKLFKLFLESNDLQYAIVGDYFEEMDRFNRYKGRRYLCYAYSDIDTKAVANMTFIKLKYGSVEQAYAEYIKDIMSQNMHETYYTRAP